MTRFFFLEDHFETQHKKPTLQTIKKIIMILASIRHFTFAGIVILTCMGNKVTGQQSIYDEKGNIKSIELRKLEESNNNQRKVDLEKYNSALNKQQPLYIETEGQRERIKQNDLATDWPKKKPASYIFDGGEFAAVKSFGKWGFVDSSNTLIVPFIYDGATNSSEGLGPVTIDCIGCQDRKSVV